VSARTLTVEHDGISYNGYIATIDSTMLGFEDHGILTAFLHLSWPGGGIGVGGYSYDTFSKREDRRIGTGFGTDQIIRILQTVGVSTWEALKGRQVVVLFNGSAWGSVAAGIAHISEDRVLILQDHSTEFLRRRGEVTDAEVAAFKLAWERADDAGEYGSRVLAGLAAVKAVQS
jgi:hypothetical protein